MDTKHITFPEGVPLIDRNEGYDGTIRTIRVIGSRITLDTLVGVYQRGDTVEELTEAFPSLSLAQIKAVIGCISLIGEKLMSTWKKEKLKLKRPGRELRANPAMPSGGKSSCVIVNR